MVGGKDIRNCIPQICHDLGIIFHKKALIWGLEILRYYIEGLFPIYTS
jgi:hypothetical protein